MCCFEVSSRFRNAPFSHGLIHDESGTQESASKSYNSPSAHIKQVGWCMQDAVQSVHSKLSCLSEKLPLQVPDVSSRYEPFWQKLHCLDTASTKRFSFRHSKHSPSTHFAHPSSQARKWSAKTSITYPNICPGTLGRRCRQGTSPRPD